MIDVNKLTLGEVAKIEELSGQAIQSLGDDAAPKGLALAAFAFVAKRREDPKFTWNMAQELTFEQANAILGTGSEDEEEEAADPLEEPAAPRSRKTQRKS